MHKHTLASPVSVKRLGKVDVGEKSSSNDQHEMDAFHVPK